VQCRSLKLAQIESLTDEEIIKVYDEIANLRSRPPGDEAELRWRQEAERDYTTEQSWATGLE
jgi:hypothetical protein